MPGTLDTNPQETPKNIYMITKKVSALIVHCTSVMCIIKQLPFCGSAGYLFLKDREISYSCLFYISVINSRLFILQQIHLLMNFPVMKVKEKQYK